MGEDTVKLVPPGTTGAIPLKEALKIQFRKLGVPWHTNIDGMNGRK